MKLPVILAHGALGGFDELLFVAVVVIFVVVMGISWLRTRSQPEEDETTLTPANESSTTDQSDSPDRFKLD